VAFSTPSLSSTSSPTAPHKPCPRLDELEFGTLLGEGAFARVFHAKDLRDGAEYAVKLVHKRTIQAKGRLNSVLVEKDMLSALDHPGIARLLYAFQTDWSLYLVLELANGGELAAQIARMGTCPLEFARFYTAEIVSILGYLRQRRVAHRDLKPENLLLTLQGHLKLVDFDAAVMVPHEGEGDAAAGEGSAGRFRGQPAFAGTSLYMPPEVLLSAARSREAFALDLWALGCILFQMLVGETPFHAASEYLAFQRILRGDYSFPDTFPHEARALVESLLAPEPCDRPGMGREGIVELCCHSFFGGAEDAFDELLASKPPPRVMPRRREKPSSSSACRPASRPDEGCVDPPRCTCGCEAMAGSASPLASPGRSTSPAQFDFDSSAECTPEVGQSFLMPSTRRSVEAEVGSHVRLCVQCTAANAGQLLGQSAAASSAFAGPMAPAALDVNVGGAASAGDSDAALAPAPCLAAAAGVGVAGAAVASDDDVADASLAPAFCGTTLGGRWGAGWTSPLSSPSTESRPSAAAAAAASAAAETQRPSALSNTSTLQLAAPVGRHWPQELARAGLLLRGEGVALAGGVIRRWLPCLRPQVLVLTDLPRLLVLDASGTRLLHDVDLASLGATGGGLFTRAREFSVEVRSPTDFILSAPGLRRLRCNDVHLGSEEWASKLQAARQQALVMLGRAPALPTPTPALGASALSSPLLQGGG